MTHRQGRDRVRPTATVDGAGLLTGFPVDVRERILATEWYIRQDPVSPQPPQTELTV